MDAGADDYITKPFDQHELQVRLRAGKRLADLQSELLSAREALREQASKDSLTRLWNRRSILDMLGRELARSSREPTPIGVVIVDLDHFKNVNDSQGHLVGDAVLCEAARRMQSAIRQYDSIGRYGGEEFLILLPGCDEQTSFTQAERLRKQIGNAEMSLQRFLAPVDRQLRRYLRHARPALDLGGSHPKGRRGVISGEEIGTQSGGVSELRLPSQTLAASAAEIESIASV